MDENHAAKSAKEVALVGPEALRARIDAGEIVVYYQPQVELATGYVRRVEALARWMPGTGNITRRRAKRSGLIG